MGQQQPPVLFAADLLHHLTLAVHPLALRVSGSQRNTDSLNSLRHGLDPCVCIHMSDRGFLLLSSAWVPPFLSEGWEELISVSAHQSAAAMADPGLPSEVMESQTMLRELVLHGLQAGWPSSLGMLCRQGL